MGLGSQTSPDRARAIAFACVLATSACAAPSAPAAKNTPPSSPPAPSWTAPAGTRSIESNGGRWHIVYRTEPDPPERGAPFSVDAWVCESSRPDRPRTDVSLLVDAAMPQHQHGMNRTATIARTGAGGFRAQGLLFHMAGLWQLYFDVTEAAITERAQVEIAVE